jgi:hypothetical protein
MVATLKKKNGSFLKSRQGPEKETPNRGSKLVLEAVITHGFCGSWQLRKAGPSHTQKLFMEQVMLLLKDRDRQAQTCVQERCINWKSGWVNRG